jgi:hypothetical protein
MSYTSDHSVWTRTSAVCDSPVDLVNCAADEHGSPVHGERYIHKISQRRPRPIPVTE